MSVSMRNVTATASSTTLTEERLDRTALLISNDADKALYVSYDTWAGSAWFTVKIAAGGYWEMPLPIYKGKISGIWETGPTGAARVTETIRENF